MVTTDSISENIDFFKADDPRSVATKITTSNLSDLSAMGATPYCYTLHMICRGSLSKPLTDDLHIDKILKATECLRRL